MPPPRHRSNNRVNTNAVLIDRGLPLNKRQKKASNRDNDRKGYQSSQNFTQNRFLFLE